MILAIDTSSTVAVAVVDADQVLASRSEFAPRSHAELLAGFVHEVLAEADATVTAIVVGTGPAPFTGLRVGLVTARTLGAAWEVPVHGVCSLDALGAQTAARHGAEAGGDVTVVTDARRKEVYWARYRDGHRFDGPQVSAPGDVPAAGLVVGRGAVLYPAVFPDAMPGDPDPVWLAREATRRIGAGQRDLPADPLYLRRPDVYGVAAP